MDKPAKIHFIEWNSEYERMMTFSLKQEFNVFEIYRVKQHYKKLHALLPGKTLKNLHRKLHMAIKFRHVAAHDIVICNGYSAFLLLDLIAPLTCKKIVVLRDSVQALTEKRRRLRVLGPDENYLDRARPVFDAVYSFDPEDCEKYQLSYIDQFLPFTSNNIRAWAKESQATTFANTCFYIGGYDPYRAELIEKLAPELEKHHCHSQFYLVGGEADNVHYPSVCINQKLSYSQNIKKIQHASVVLEINKPGQTGLTLRALEAMIFGKKLITNNTAVRQYDFYHPDRIFIWGEDNPARLGSFISTVVEKADMASMEKYCADGMLRTLTGSALK